ncbi:hypothetical protein NDU88_001646 [Pleurodeles waltl]|uniref:Uncharacterized protein n=1 Tax=Pleurodeles waltl TaxID=8319 RepID=A0AAV7T0K5_PLEWA|nr:hypothetical protein NDU88_001646 [Pleurodeles waltl]
METQRAQTHRHEQDGTAGRHRTTESSLPQTRQANGSAPKKPTALRHRTSGITVHPRGPLLRDTTPVACVHLRTPPLHHTTPVA